MSSLFINAPGSHRVWSVVLAIGGAATSLLAIRDVSALRPVTLGLVAAELVVAIIVGPFGGIVVGVCAAAAFVAAHLAQGAWRTHSAPLLLATAAALVAYGWLSGVVGSRLRPGAGDPGTLLFERRPGVLSREDGLVYLEAEFTRASEYRRPLALLVLRMDHITSKRDDLRCRLWGTLARSVMSELPAIAAPFAISDAEVGIVLPEHGLSTARAIGDRLHSRVSSATFTDPQTGERRTVADTGDLAIGASHLEPSVAHATGLLAAARADVGRPADPRPLPEQVALAGAHRA